MVTCNRKKTIITCSLMIGYLFDAISVALAEKMMVVLILQSRNAEKLQETVVSHLKCA